MNAIATIRGSGTTTWILKAAIKSPRCIIISRDEHTSINLRLMYFRLLSEEHWLKKLYWKIFGREEPLFRSLNSSLGSFQGLKRPIIFDNSALL